MPSEWRQTAIGDQATLQRGFDITKAQQRPGRIPVVSSSGVSSHHDTAKVAGPGVVLGRKGVVGSVHYIDQDYWPHDTTLWVKDFHGNDPRFVYYFFRSFADVLAGMDTGTSNPTLNRNHVHPIEVQWPRLPEQHAIASVLGALDDKIELNRRMNRTLEEMAAALFKSWFVDFDPVHAKAEGRRPFGMDDETAALFPERFVETDEGAVPEGWEVTPFSSFIDLISGGTPKTKVEEYWDGPYPWFSVVDAPSDGGVFVHKTQKTITDRGLAESAATLLPVGATIISARGTVGKLGLTATEMAMNQSCYGMFPRQPYGCGFVFLAATRLVDSLRQRAQGSVFDTIIRSTFDDVSMMKPTPEVAAVFEENVWPLFNLIKSNGAESITLSDFRDTLLPRLLSGEIRLKQAEKSVEGVV